MEVQKSRIILIKGAGEKASAVAHGLYKNGYEKLIMTDTSAPLAERRGVCFCEAVFDQKKEIDGVLCEKTEPSVDSVRAAWAKKTIPLLTFFIFFLLFIKYQKIYGHYQSPKHIILKFFL